MTYKYQSNFADDLIAMFNYKIALGYSAISYEGGLRRLDMFFLEYFPTCCVLSQEIVNAWCDHENVNNKAPNHAIIIREFAKFLNSIGKDAYVLPDKARKKYKPELPCIFTEAEISAFFHATDIYPHRNNSPLLEYTIPTIFRVQFACGLRPKEVLHLQKTDIDYKNKNIYIRQSKRHKDRVLPVSDDVIQLCKKYNEISKIFYPEAACFFPSNHGDVYESGWLERAFRKCWIAAGNTIENRVPSPYDLRHNFATRTLMKWVEEGKDLDSYIPYLSAYMGHGSFSSTFYYIHLLPERLSKMAFMDAGTIIGGANI